MDSIVAVATASDPRQRYASCGQFMEALRSYGRKFSEFDE
jgi:hypothetical protein